MTSHVCLLSLLGHAKESCAVGGGSEEHGLSFPLAPLDHSERQEEEGTTSPWQRILPLSHPGGILHSKPHQRSPWEMRRSLGWWSADVHQEQNSCVVKRLWRFQLIPGTEFRLGNGPSGKSQQQEGSCAAMSHHLSMSFTLSAVLSAVLGSGSAGCPTRCAWMSHVFAFHSQQQHHHHFLLMPAQEMTIRFHLSKPKPSKG